MKKTKADQAIYCGCRENGEPVVQRKCTSHNHSDRKPRTLAQLQAEDAGEAVPVAVAVDPLADLRVIRNLLELQTIAALRTRVVMERLFALQSGGVPVPDDAGLIPVLETGAAVLQLKRVEI